jgi:hypothetical protein
MLDEARGLQRARCHLGIDRVSFGPLSHSTTALMSKSTSIREDCIYGQAPNTTLWMVPIILYALYAKTYLCLSISV